MMGHRRRVGIDAVELALGVDELREVMRAAVAGLVADGFTDREAHAIVAGVFANMIPKDDDAEEGSS